MNLKKLSDHELLNTYISGNEDSINVLLNRHRKRILDYIYMMVKNRDVADDIFQETLIKVVRFVQEGRYTENGKFLSYLGAAHSAQPGDRLFPPEKTAEQRVGRGCGLRYPE